MERVLDSEKYHGFEEQTLGVEKWGYSGEHILGVEERHCFGERLLVPEWSYTLGIEECLCSHCVLGGAYVWSSQSASRSLELLRDQWSVAHLITIQHLTFYITHIQT